MKKTIAVLFVALAALSLAACSAKNSGGEIGEGGNVQIANPWVDCATLSDAAKLAGFDVTMPGKIEGYPNKVIQAMEKTMIQVLYFDGDPEAEDSSMVMVRKGTGSEDISGDYNEYPEDETALIHGVSARLKGEGGLVYSAVWTWDGCSFAVNADRGLSRKVLDGIIEEMVTVVG